MRIPLSSTLKTRDSTTNKGARLLNAYVEVRGDPKKGGIVRTVKRPCLDSAYQAAEGIGQLLITTTTPGTDPDDPDETLVVITTDTVDTSPGRVPRDAVFFVQPSEVEIDFAISPAIVVRVIDRFGQLSTLFDSNVRLSFAENPENATLSGTLTVAAVAGVATFSNVKINTAGEGYRLKATSAGIRPGTSDEFDVVAASEILMVTAFSSVIKVISWEGALSTSFDSAGEPWDTFTTSAALACIGNNIVFGPATGPGNLYAVSAEDFETLAGPFGFATFSNQSPAAGSTVCIVPNDTSSFSFLTTNVTPQAQQGGIANGVLAVESTSNLHLDLEGILPNTARFYFDVSGKIGFSNEGATSYLSINTVTGGFDEIAFSSGEATRNARLIIANASRVIRVLVNGKDVELSDHDGTLVDTITPFPGVNVASLYCDNNHLVCLAAGNEGKHYTLPDLTATDISTALEESEIDGSSYAKPLVLERTF